MHGPRRSKYVGSSHPRRGKCSGKESYALLSVSYKHISGERPVELRQTVGALKAETAVKIYGRPLRCSAARTRPLESVSFVIAWTKDIIERCMCWSHVAKINRRSWRFGDGRTMVSFVVVRTKDTVDGVRILERKSFGSVISFVRFMSVICAAREFLHIIFPSYSFFQLATMIHAMRGPPDYPAPVSYLLCPSIEPVITSVLTAARNKGSGNVHVQI